MQQADILVKKTDSMENKVFGSFLAQNVIFLSNVFVLFHWLEFHFYTWKPSNDTTQLNFKSYLQPLWFPTSKGGGDYLD